RWPRTSGDRALLILGGFFGRFLGRLLRLQFLDGLARFQLPVLQARVVRGVARGAEEPAAAAPPEAGEPTAGRTTAGRAGEPLRQVLHLLELLLLVLLEEPVDLLVRLLLQVGELLLLVVRQLHLVLHRGRNQLARLR